MQEYSFDLYRIFFGDEFCLVFVLEIFLRTLFIYSYAVVNIRLMDKRNLSQLTSFEMIIIIALGAAVGDPLVYSHVPLITCMLVISLIVSFEKFISIITERSELIDTLISGKPRLLVKFSEIDTVALKKEDMTRADLFSRLRVRGITNIAQVKFAFIEPSGHLSIVKYNNGSEEGESTYLYLVDKN